MARSQLSFYGTGGDGPGDDGSDDGERKRPAGRDRGAGPPVWSVSQIVRGAHRVLEDRFSNIWIEGEVSSLKVGGNGHAFFSLVDEGAALPAAMWRTSVERLRFSLAEGQVLRVYGRLGVFPKQGRMQFYVDRAEPAGLGALMLELEQRKERLQAEGLFDPARKRPLPAWPRGIGVVTSAHGAAIHDILEVTRRRCPCRVVLSPAVVQGPDAPRSLARALRRVCGLAGIDVVIIGRGGGSVEDLWAFNDEQLARVIAGCPVPIVSAVGHEVDVTICDLVADLRAATPSHAAELVVPDRGAAQDRLSALEKRLQRAQTRHVLDERQRLEAAVARLARIGRGLVQGPRAQCSALERRLAALHPRRRVDADRRRLDTMTQRLLSLGRALPRAARARQVAMERRLVVVGRALPRPARLRLARAAGALQALSPLSVLERGYAVVTGPTGSAIIDATALHPDDRIEIRLARGRARATVTDVDPGEKGR